MTPKGTEDKQQAPAVNTATVARQPSLAEDQLQPRGFLGVEWSESKIEPSNKENGKGASARLGPRIDRVLQGSAAAKGGLQAGDRIIKIRDKVVNGVSDARAALANVRPGDTVPLTVRRGEGTEARELILTVAAGEGL